MQHERSQFPNYAPMPMPNSRSAKLISAITLVLTGVICLAMNFGLLTPEMLNQVWKAWPVVLLAYGAVLLFQLGSEKAGDASGKN